MQFYTFCSNQIDASGGVRLVLLDYPARFGVNISSWIFLKFFRRRVTFLASEILLALSLIQDKEEGIRLKHIYQEGKEGKPTLLLLHGTGGTEHDLLPIGNMIDPDAGILSVRGEVLENGMPRFFRRLAEGVFDLEDLVVRTKDLNSFIGQAADDYGFDRKNVIAVGYSNGANIAASLLFHYEDALKGAILHHPMVPIRDKELPPLNGTSVFIGAGTNDPICPMEEAKDLKSLLEDAGAEVHVHWENFGHSLTRTEIEAAADWYHNKY